MKKWVFLDFFPRLEGMKEEKKKMKKKKELELDKKKEKKMNKKEKSISLLANKSADIEKTRPSRPKMRPLWMNVFYEWMFFYEWMSFVN